MPRKVADTEPTPMPAEPKRTVDATAMVDFDTLPDPAAIDAAAEQARTAADHRESQAFLSRLAAAGEGNAVRVATYRKMAADPRVPRLAALLRKIDRGKFATWCNERQSVLAVAIKPVDRTQGWASQADRADEAAAQISRLTGKACERLSGWKENGIWSPTVQKLSRWLLDVSATEAELESQLAAAEEALGNAVQLYAGAVARHAGVPLVEVREPVRSEPLRSELDFNPMKMP